MFVYCDNCLSEASDFLGILFFNTKKSSMIKIQRFVLLLKTTKIMKLNSDHHEILLNFAEKNQQIITNRFVGLNASAQNNSLWQKLANQLNALGYGSLSVSEYKRRLTDWKSKTKGKAAQINAGLQGTGGGECTNVSLTKHEQRLLVLMGNKAYQGDDVQERGFSKNENATRKRKHNADEKKENDVPTKTLKPQKPTFITLHTSSIPKYSSKGTIPETYSAIPTLITLPNQNTVQNMDSLHSINSARIIKHASVVTPLIKENLLQTEPPCLPYTFTSRQSDSEEDLNIEGTQEESIVAETRVSSGVSHEEISEGRQRTPSTSTNRRRGIINMGEAIKNMNDETLTVLRSIDQNLVIMNENLQNITEIFKDMSDCFKKKIFSTSNINI